MEKYCIVRIVTSYRTFIGRLFIINIIARDFAPSDDRNIV